MKYSMLFITLFVLPFVSMAQEPVNPGSGIINMSVFRPGAHLIKLIWIDKDGKVTKEATLMCITRIDSVKKRLTYLQIRNDGKKDSTVSEWPSLKPIFSSSVYQNQIVVFNYTNDGHVLEAKTTDRYGVVKKDTTYKIEKVCFDSYLTDYLVGALPLKPGYTGKFIASAGVPYIMGITQVSTDVMNSESGFVRQAYLVNVDYNGYKVLYWIDKNSGEMIKFIAQQPDGSIFMKSKI